MPKVSVLMPVYNTKEEFLRETIEAVLNQTYRDFEFLIINDASTTNVRDVILSYDDPRIVYIENEQNLGISRTSNKGLQLAKGEYIARQDHDDISEPGRFYEQVKFLDAHPEVGVCGCFFRVFPKGQDVRLPIDDEGIKIRTVTEGAAICHPAAMIRKSVLQDNGITYHDEYRYAEDYQLWVDLLDKTKFHNIPEYLFRYRWFGGNASVTAGSAQAESAFKVRLNAVLALLNTTSSEIRGIFARLYQDKKYCLGEDEFHKLFAVMSSAYQNTPVFWKKKAIHKIYRRVLRQARCLGWWERRVKWRFLL